MLGKRGLEEAEPPVEAVTETLDDAEGLLNSTEELLPRCRVRGQPRKGSQGFTLVQDVEDSDEVVGEASLWLLLLLCHGALVRLQRWSIGSYDLMPLSDPTIHRGPGDETRFRISGLLAVEDVAKVFLAEIG